MRDDYRRGKMSCAAQYYEPVMRATVEYIPEAEVDDWARRVMDAGGVPLTVGGRKWSSIKTQRGGAK